MSLTVRLKSSSATPSGEPIWVSEMKAKRKGCICAETEIQRSKKQEIVIVSFMQENYTILRLILNGDRLE